jgi:hypothetical protein
MNSAFVMRWLVLGTGFGMLGAAAGIVLPIATGNPDQLTNSMLTGLMLGVFAGAIPSVWLTRTNRDGLNPDPRPLVQADLPEWTSVR